MQNDGIQLLITWPINTGFDTPVEASSFLSGYEQDLLYLIFFWLDNKKGFGIRQRQKSNIPKSINILNVN